MSDTVFVPMFHPGLPGTPHVLAPLRAEDLYAAKGWLVVDGSTPAPAAEFITPLAGDLRYVQHWQPSLAVTAGALFVAPDGQPIQRIANGATRATYDATEQALWTAALKAALVPFSVRPRPNTVGLLGTSITTFNAIYDQGGGALAYQGEGYFFQAAAMLRQDANLILQAGVSGDTTGQMLARVGTVIAAAPAWCVVETGPNDIMGNSTFSNITTALTGLYQALLAAGIGVFAGEINPTSSMTAAQLLVARRVNRWIREYGASNPGVVPVLWSGPMSDPVTGGPLAGTLFDGTHPNTYGAGIMGKALAAAMRPYITSLDRGVPGLNADATNGLSNGLLTGDGGSGVATGWTLTNQGGTAVFTASKVARTDGGAGEWQQIALTSGEVRLIQAAPSGGVWAVGDKVRAQIEVDGDFTNATGLVLFCQALNSGGSVLQQTLGLQDYHSTTKRVAYSRAMLRTPDLTIPANTTSVSLQARVVGAATARFGAASIRNAVIG